jgi:phenylacetate-coenzyme A ligase PaaK-like adenylate-forming protein
VRRVHASSGTTGRPTVVGYTENDIDMWADVIARSIRAAGDRAGHKVVIVNPDTLERSAGKLQRVKDLPR